MLNSELKVQECDARNDDSSNAAGYKNIFVLFRVFLWPQ
jgi:hypothetical protein